MDFELARTLTHETLRDMLKRSQSDPHYASQFSGDMQLANIVARVEKQAQKGGHLGQNTPLTMQDMQNFVTHTLWELVVQGVLVPHNSNSLSQGWPFVSFTEYGAKVIFGKSPTPYDPTGYLDYFTSADAVVKFYVEEALGCFRANRYTAAVVMLGVSSERLFDLLLDAFVSSLASATEKSKLQKETAGKFVTGRYDALKKRLDPKKNQLPQPLRDNLDTSLVSIFNLIRQTRNDSGHPTGRAMTREETYALLNIFPHYYKYVSDLISYLQQHPNSLTSS